MNPFRSSRPSSLPVRDPIDDPTDNCCHNCMHISVTLIHLVEFIFGLALMGYSIAISTHKPDPQRGFAITLQAWASLFIASSVLGTLGLTKNYCRRIPLTISAYIGLVQTVIAFVFFLIIYLERDSLLNYFNDKHQQLYLSTGFITFFDKNIGVIYGFLFLLIAAGFARFSFIHSMKEDFILHDRAKRSGLLRVEENNNGARATERNEWVTDDQRGNECSLAKSNLTSPLIENNHNEANDLFHPPNESTSQWWEDDNPDESNHAKKESMVTIEHNKRKSWISRLSWRSSSRNESDTSVAHNNNGNDDLFSPIDEEIEFQEPAPDARTLAASFNESDNIDNSITPSWVEDGDISQLTSNNDTDLSWTRDDSK